jgi:PAS domain S-box-containing protein
VTDNYRQIVVQFPYAVFIESSEGQILDANAAAAAVLNVPLKDLIGRQTSEILSPASLERLSQQLKSLEKGGHLRTEAQFILAGGKPVTRLLEITPIRWPAETSGAPNAFLVIAREVDPVDELNRENAVYRCQSSVGAAGQPKAVFLVTAGETALRFPRPPAKGKDDRPLSWAGALLLGPSLRRALDQAWGGKDVFLEPAWYSSNTAGIASSSAEALAAVAEQARSSMNTNEKQFWLEIALTPLRGAGSEVSGICAQVLDRTAERIQTEQERMIDDQAVLTLLATSIRHELNNYLSVIIAQASALRMSLAPGQLPPPNIGAILDAGQEAVALLRRASEVAGRGDAAFADVRLNDVVADACQVLRHMLPEKVRISMDLNPEVPITRGEPRLLRAAILFLAGQAQLRASAGGTVAFKTWSPPSVHVSVPPGASLIMEIAWPPQRATKGSGQVPGESANVAIARAIARYHKGQLEISSGATGVKFEMNLPGLERAPIAVQQPPVAAQKPVLDPEKLLKNLSRTAGEGPRPQADDEDLPKASSQRTPGKRRILVADDEENFRSFIGWTLRQRGYEVVLAANGQEAFERFQESPATFHLAILDAYMPIMGGLEAYLRMHVLRPDLPVLFASGFFRSPSIEALIEGCPGPAAVLMKPFGADDLIKSVETALFPAETEGEFEPETPETNGQ